MAGLAVLAVLTVGCAAGSTPSGPGNDLGGHDGGGSAEAGQDAYIWPDMGPPPDAFIHPDGVKLDISQLPDTGPVDAGPPPDTVPPPDSQVPCPDPLEPNQTCSSGKSLGTLKESSTWIKKTGTMDPGTDIDWFTAKGEEKSHTCLPLTSQCYKLKVKLTVPAGRKLKVCVYKDSCTALGTCKSGTGPTVLDVEYKVSGTCAFNDDTDAKIKVEQQDGTGGCDPYEVSFNYNDC
jgi:hypothetical protein